MPLERLKPVGTQRVMDLVARAGIDVGPCRFRADGTEVEFPAANPAHRYEWCFAAPRGPVVLSLWFDNMVVCDGDRRNLEDLARRDPSRVERRLLDPAPWRVREYDWILGHAVVARDEPLP